MAFTYSLANNIGQVRLMIPDNVVARYIFEDDEITAFLTIEGASLKKATALALETLASNEALVLKVIRLLDLQTDGAKTSEALLKRAVILRTQAEAADTGAAFDFAELVYDDFGARERIIDEALRDA